MAEEKYVIEGTVTEISSEKLEEVTFKIAGTEGYAIKLGKKKYNVLCTKKILENTNDEDTAENESKIFDETFILSQEIQFSSNDIAKVGLIRCNALGKHVKLKIDPAANISVLLNSKLSLPVSSIKIYAN